MSTAKFFIALLFAVPVAAQQTVPATEISFERVTRASKEFLRDSAELPMRLDTEFSATDLHGQVLKQRIGKFDYDFHGYNPRSNNGALNLQGPKRSMKEAGTLAAITMLPSILVSPGVEHRLKMLVIDSPQPDIVAAEFAPEKDSFSATYAVQVNKEKPVPDQKAGSSERCQSVGWMRKAYLFTNICLSRAQLYLHKDDLSAKSFVWHTGGLPVRAKVDYLGEANITGYVVEMDFQKATLPDDPKPFVVPWHVTVVVVTDKGRLLMAGEFALKK